MNQMLRQAIDLLMLSNLELVQKIEQEMVANPLLEEIIDTATQNVSIDTVEEKIDNQKTDSKMDDEDYLVWKDHLEDDSSYKSGTYEQKEESNYEEYTTRKASLQDHLLWQLDMIKLPYHEYKIGELIIGSLNHDGYFASSIEELAQSLNISHQEVEKILKIIQKFDPLGVAAAKLQECLYIQVRELYPTDKFLHNMIQNYFEDICERRFQKIAQELNIDTEKVHKYFELITALEPKPGRQYSSELIKYVVPDVIIKKEDDNYVVIVNDNYLPRLRINEYYKKILQKSDTQEIKKYLKQKLDSAAWLLNSIDQRKSTLFKVVTQIVEHQKKFLDKGILHLKPLSLSDIALQVGMHESTISRVTTNKYAETPMGIFELKYFFVRGMENIFGEDISTARIKDKIRTIVENENKSKPISDQKIVEVLKQEGLNIARRTVTKYREEMNILASSKRKSFELYSK
ncbi:RNA polymerase factor sigma-54 [Candidatus Poribacteria bacterium]|nr:RNA polymerase factor sigma-54 [Candidatus Poribacteria bacterium]